MADDTGKPILIAIAEQLQRHGVEFMVIGGQAANLLGSPQLTFDIDPCYQRTPDNLRRLADALRELHPTLRGAPPDVPFRLDAESLALGANFTFRTDLGPLDLLGWVEPLGTYEQLLPRAERVRVGALDLLCISLDDLIAVKRHIGRPKDKAGLLQLEGLKRLRDERKGNAASGS
jgi:predicted nucleotidyltransferase